jgi:hypothetical protein
MGINKSVFASRSERDNYHKLCRTWERSHHIYHNLPFLNIFNPKDLIDISDFWHPRSFNLSDTDFAKLKKTSVDYTLCNEADNPILCIEFDGMQQGFNVGTVYHPDNNSLPNPWRQEITELKLRVALGSSFPYFVVGSKYFDDLSPNVKLTIVDGIIGNVLASKFVRERTNQGFDPEDMGWTQEDFNKLPEWDQQEIIQDWVIGIEVEADMTHNPVVRKRWSEEYISLFKSYSSTPTHYPEVDMNLPLQERARQIDNAILHGTRVTIHRPDIGDIQTTIWLPNFKIIGLSGLSLAEDIAIILTCERLTKRGAGPV